MQPVVAAGIARDACCISRTYLGPGQPSWRPPGRAEPVGSHLQVTLLVHCRGGEVPMAMGPWDPMAASRGRLLASDAEREQVIDALKAAFAQGLLTSPGLASSQRRMFSHCAA